MIKGTDPSEKKVWVTSSGKVPRTCEILAGGRGSREQVVEKGTSKYYLRPHE